MRIAREEIKTEMMACTHIVLYVFCYSLLMQICCGSPVSFWTILEMSILGYVLAWFQTLLFFKDRAYSKKSYVIRSICWIVVPSVSTVITSLLCKWFSGVSAGVEWGYYGFIVFYFVCFWFFLKVFFKKETNELNKWLADYKKG